MAEKISKDLEKLSLSKLQVKYKANKYSVKPQWVEGDYIRLDKIVNNLPEFIAEHRILSAYSELKQLKYCKDNDKDIDYTKFPYMKEFTTCSPDHTCTIRGNFCAKQLSSSSNGYNLIEKSFYCEYMLKVAGPSDFDELNKDPDRWIFIPSFMRCKSGLFDWDEVGITPNVHRILVVRPCMYEEYKKHCGHILHVICLPHDEIGVGYARHWCIKIALKLNLKFCWLFDDDVKQFQKKENDEWVEISFEKAFKAVEDQLHALQNKDQVAAISPAKRNQYNNFVNLLSDRPPQTAVYLNLELISKNSIQYRPELRFLEDMIFGAECIKKGLKVYRYQEILVVDVPQWTGSGATSPSSAISPGTTRSSIQQIHDSKTAELEVQPKKLEY